MLQNVKFEVESQVHESQVHALVTISNDSANASAGARAQKEREMRNKKNWKNKIIL